MSYLRSTLLSTDAAEAVGLAGFLAELPMPTYHAIEATCPLCGHGLVRPSVRPPGRIVQAPPGAPVGEEIVVDLLPAGYDAVACPACKVWYYTPPEGA